MEIKVKKRNGKLEEFDVEKINKCVYRACAGIDGNNVSASEVILDAQLQLYDKITTKEIDEALILSARAKIEKEPNYSNVAAALAVNALYKEVFRESVDSDTFDLQYKKSFVQGVKKLVKNEILNEKLLEYDLKKLSDAIDPSRDEKFKASHLLRKLSTSKKVPFLLIWGEKDNFIPLFVGKKIANFHRWVKLKIVSNSGHCIHDEDPSVFNSISYEWIRDLKTF